MAGRFRRETDNCTGEAKIRKANFYPGSIIRLMKDKEDPDAGNRVGVGDLLP